MTTVTGSDVSIDWADLEQVKELARKLGPKMLVIKRKDRNTFNIIHSDGEWDLAANTSVIYRT